ncbi:MAG: fatty acid desaturase [Gammaproteobacteria bacterium]
MNGSLCLPQALRGEQTALSKEALKEIGRLRGAAPWQWSMQAALAWLVIAGSIAFAVWADNLLVTLVAIVVIATRQNVFGLLIHEQTHRCGFKGKYGDWIANLVAGYPLLVLSVEGYGKVHLAHHRDYFTEKDPDFVRKQGPAWKFPKRPSEVARIFLTDLVGLTLYRNIKSKNIEIGDGAFIRPNPTPRWLKIGYFSLWAIVITVLGGWEIFFVYWLLPLVTVLQVIVRWAAMFEHIYETPNAGVAESTPIIVPSLLNKILLPNLNFSLHPYHHYFAGVPFCNLMKVHEIFVREGLVDEAHVFHGYLSYFKFLTSAPVDAAAPA